MWSTREEPSFSSDGVQDSDKDGALLGEMGERGKGPQAEKLRQQRCSFQLWLAKPLKNVHIGIHHTHKNIGYSILKCLKCNCAYVHVWLHILKKLKKRLKKKSTEKNKTERETVIMFSQCQSLENTPWNLLFHRKWQSKHHELIPWWRSGSLCSCFLLFASACPDTG